MSYDSVEVLDSKVKSKQQQVEITLGLNTNSSNYDESKGTIGVIVHLRIFWGSDISNKGIAKSISSNTYNICMYV